MEKQGSQKPLVSNFTLSLVAIVAIVLIVVITTNYTPSKVQIDDKTNTVSEGTDSVGQAFVSLDVQRTCKLSVSGTTLFDSQALHVTLKETESAYYQGNTITLSETNANGCIIDVNGNEDFLAIGQVQRVDSVYILVTDVSN